MIELTRGDILRAEAEALVNTVNCVGVMGRGIALQFKRAFPVNFAAYAAACKRDEMQPGRMLVVDTGQLTNPRWIVNFPTKRHWKGKSRLEDIDAGLDALIADVKRLGIKSIAVPPLGCGLGGLDWYDVRPRIERAFAALADVRVLVYEPSGAPEASAMTRSTEAPKMTPGRAVLVGLMERYLRGLLDPFISLLEVHKLMYFMQEAGQPLKLQYREHLYGPYAPNLKKVLEVVEGHYLRGYVDSEKPDVEIDLLPGATQEAEAFLSSDEAALGRLARVGQLIEGYETPYGMELLATVHWVGQHKGARTVEEAIELVHAWSARKAELFRVSHIRHAWARLSTQGWVASPS